jgi:hypothetical protein
MALVLLDIDRRKWRRMFNSAQAGDAEAIEEFRQLWLGYEDLECFLCAKAIPSDACYSEPLAHRDRADLVMVAPLCSECRALPTLQRLHRTGKMLGKMWKTKNGNPMRFSYRMPWSR